MKDPVLSPSTCKFNDKVKQVHLRTEIASKLHEATFSDRTFEYTIGKK